MRHSESVHDLKIVCFPKKLVVDGRPELLVFPLQVAFIVATDGGRTVQASSFIPDLATYAVVGSEHRLVYDNILGGDSTLRITFNLASGIYTGTKLIDGRFVARATGVDWDRFNFYLAQIGIVDGERCEVKRLK